MEIAFVAGFGPIGDPSVMLGFWAQAVGIQFEEIGKDYHHSSDLGGVKAFALWPLSQAAEATFGTASGPTTRPVPQAWIEFEVSSPGAVADSG